MPLLILAGLPTDLVRRLKGALRAGHALREGWSIEYVNARHKDPAIANSDLEKILELASSNPESHVVGVSKQDGTIRQDIAAKIRPYFRFRWLENTLLPLLGSNAGDFVNSLNEVLDEEQIWTNELKPTTVSHPLVLPQNSFRCDRPYQEIWARSKEWGDRNNILATAEAIRRFSVLFHRRPDNCGTRRWVDLDQLVFNHAGARHGVAPFPRNWKYSFRLEDRFHYDVTSEREAPFVLFDAQGRQHSRKAGEHVNMDPHGYVRET